MLTNEDDQDLRRYARWLNPDMGEDAYHDAVCGVCARRQADQILTVRTFYRVAIKRALFKIFRHEQAEREQIASWLAGDPPPMTVGLVEGRKKRTHCLKGHLLSEDNLAYIGPRRTCRTCKRAREALAARTARAHLKEVIHA